MACIILKEGEASSVEEIKAFVLSHMAKHKVPRYIEFVEAFPMNAAGKILTTFANALWNKGGWIQNRANTLALWCMFAQVFPLFQDEGRFAGPWRRRSPTSRSCTGC